MISDSHSQLNPSSQSSSVIYRSKSKLLPPSPPSSTPEQEFPKVLFSVPFFSSSTSLILTISQPPQCSRYTPFSYHPHITLHITFIIYPSFFTWIPSAVPDRTASLPGATFFEVKSSSGRWCLFSNWHVYYRVALQLLVCCKADQKSFHPNHTTALKTSELNYGRPGEEFYRSLSVTCLFSLTRHFGCTMEVNNRQQLLSLAEEAVW